MAKLSLNCRPQDLAHFILGSLDKEGLRLVLKAAPARLLSDAMEAHAENVITTTIENHLLYLAGGAS